MLLAAAALRLAPAASERLRENTIAAPLRNIGVGFLTLGATIGLVPVTAMTIIGIPFIPLVLAAIAALWIAGYLLTSATVNSRALLVGRALPRAALAAYRRRTLSGRKGGVQVWRNSLAISRS